MIRGMSHGEADYFDGSDATQRDHRYWGRCASQPSVPHLITPLQRLCIKNLLVANGALHQPMVAVSSPYRDSGAYLSRRVDTLEGENSRC
jgi:hypothetical protein